MQLEAIYHKPYSQYAFPLDEKTLVLRIRTKKNEINNVLAVFHEKFDLSIKGSASMEKVYSDERFDYFEAKLNQGIKRFKYMFYLESAYEHKWFCANGFSNERPEEGYFTFANISREDIFIIPDWFKNSVIYQVFPDRFYNPELREDSPGYRKWIHKKMDSFSYFGGTIKGVLEKIKYLSNLGINTLYLNPVFEANSYHRYDTVDYYNIDWKLGTNQDFKEMVEICHESGIRVIIDAVFNHCSRDFFAFKDILQNGENSKYSDWFIIKEFPITAKPSPNYECFGFYEEMPKFNTANGEVQKYFLEVINFWMDYFKIDGLRFDAADEIDHNFWRLIRKIVKAKNKDMMLIGEIWDEASSWLEGDQFDSVLSYPLFSLIKDMIAYKSIKADTFNQRLNGYLFSFNHNAVNNLVNIIGSHDTARFLTLCKNNSKRFILGLVLQFTLPGVPLIYYGDEVGMKGEGDPHCRKPMIWDEIGQNKDIFNVYKFLIEIKKREQILSFGNYKAVETIGCKMILCFKRFYENEYIIIVINTSGKKSKGKFYLESKKHKKQKSISIKNAKTQIPVNNLIKISLEPYEWDIYKVEIIV